MILYFLHDIEGTVIFSFGFIFQLVSLNLFMLNVTDKEKTAINCWNSPLFI